MLKKFLLALIISLVSVPSFGANILIPGYDKMSIYLSDGSEVWKADDFLEPGEAFIRIELERLLESGIYRNAVMKYECYTLDGGAKLNGAEIRVTIEVRLHEHKISERKEG